MALKTNSVTPKTESDNQLLTLDYNNLTAEAIGKSAGLTATDLSEMKSALNSVHKDLSKKYKNGLLPFMDLPKDPVIPKACKELADFGRKKFDAVVVLGIGGSALGTSAIFTALKALNHNAQPAAKRGWPRLIVADNIDPEGFSTIMESVDPKTTFFNVISKSGATAETMSQFMYVYEHLRKVLGKESIKDNLLVTTDPENGVLRKIVKAGGFRALPIPPGVGGRFSVMTAVGLAPLALAGVNIKGLLAGADRAQADTFSPVATNKAFLFAGLNWLLTTRKNRGSLIMMPYADALGKVADWFGQLWNESLGKALHLDGTPAGTGQTSIKALGATDQHSQLQMYMEGPHDKAVCFLGVDNFRTDVKIPSIFKEYGELAYLGGHSLGELINYERQGTARALAENGRPNFSLTIPKITPEALGYLLHTLEVATVVSGTLYNIDPLDQPGVELGKKFTYGLLGRTGFEDFKDRYNKGLAARKTYIVK